MIVWRNPVLSFSALPEVGPLLVASDPAWIWSRDGGRILWANPAGGARLGSRHFAELWRRGRAAGHPLLREIDSLMRSLPEKGALARLHVIDAPQAVPMACRCRRIRSADERGLLVVALDGSNMRPTWADVAEFFSDDESNAVILDETGAVLAAGAADALEIMDPDEPSACIADGGRKLRLCILERLPMRSGTEEAPLGEAGTPSAELSDSAIEGPSPIVPPKPAWDERDPLPEVAPSLPSSEPSAPTIAAASLVEEPELPVEEPEAHRPESAPLAPVRPIEASREPVRLKPSLPVKTGAAPPIGKDAGPMAEAAVAGRAPPAVEQPPARSVMAGRVARELSRKPVRFLWQTDAADRFLFVSPGLAQVVGRNAEIVGERWKDAADRLRLDPTSRIARALAQRDTWSGQTAWWPIEGSNVRVPAELTALPVFGGDHSFQGYRGFGVLRPAEALMPGAFEARFGTAEQPIPKPAEQLPPYEEAVATTPANVVPIRADLERPADHVRLTPQERSAFEEIAAALRYRVINELEAPAPALEQAAAAPEEKELAPAQEAAEPQVPGQENERPEVTAADASTEAAPPAEAMPPPAAEPPGAAARPPVPTVSVRAEELERTREPVMPGSFETAPEPLRTEQREHVSDGEMQRRLREMTAILDTATDGVLILHADGAIESANASAEALFGLDAHEMQAMHFGDLLIEESRESALDYLSGLRENGVASLLNEGREIEAKAGAGSIPLFMTMGRISGGQDGTGGRFCAVLRDITHWKRTESELLAAKRAAEAASSQKSEFLARVSHEIRTPLNAIIGFAEVMIEERFGPIEHDRYREYLRDIRTSGEHVVSLVNDLLDISKIEAGKLDLTFVAVPLNELVRECIALMQPQANRAHVVLRSSLSRDVPGIVADPRTLRQIVLNLLSNSVKFTGPGGQVIASTSLAETGEALLRVRDTGEGMSEDELARALEPFRQIATSTLANRTGTGLGLPLTKALVEANRASLAIRSARGEGTIVTVTFPPTRVLSE